MNKKMRTCSCCLTQYEYCNRCEKDKNKPQWYFAFCSENCKDIYKTISDYEDNQIDVGGAKEKLDKLDLSRLDRFGESYKKSVYKIMDEYRKTSEKANVISVDNENQESIVENDNKTRKKKSVSKSPLNEISEEVIE